MRKQVEAWQKCELTDVTAKVVIYEAFVEGQTGSAETSGAGCARPLLRTEVRGIPAANDLESLECVHFGIQGTGSYSTIQGDC